MFKKILCASVLMVMSVAFSTSAIASNTKQNINVLTPQIAAEQAANEFIKEWDKYVSCKSVATANGAIEATNYHVLSMTKLDYGAYVVFEKPHYQVNNLSITEKSLNTQLVNKQQLAGLKGKSAVSNVALNTNARLEEPISF